LLYLGGILWALGYDTIYAHQDKEDDARIGVKSSALALGARTRPFLLGFYAAALALWASACTSAGLGVLFWAGLAGAGLQLYWQAAHVNVDEPADCLTKFRSNRVSGWLLLIGIVAGHLLKWTRPISYAKRPRYAAAGPGDRLHLATESPRSGRRPRKASHATVCRRPLGVCLGRWTVAGLLLVDHPEPLAARCSILAPARDWWRSPRKVGAASPLPISTLSRPRRLPSTRR
jgi:hypothetical protein